MKVLGRYFAAFYILALISDHSFASAGNAGPRIGEIPAPLTLSEIVQGPELGDVTWDKLKGTVVVLEFWNTRCSPCIKAIPHLNELAEQFSQKNVVFISVTDDNPGHARDFLRLKPMKGWVAIDGPLTASRMAFDVEGIPHTVIVDKTGKIAAITHPARLKAEHLEEILAGKACSLPPPRIDSDGPDEEVTLVSAPAQTIIEVSIHGPFPQPKGAFNSISWNASRSEFTSQKAFLRSVLAAYFDINEKCIIQSARLPEGLYDIIVSGPTNKSAALYLQFLSAFQTAFGRTIATNSQSMEVYALTVCSTNPSNLKLAEKSGGGGEQPGGFRMTSSDMDTIASFLQLSLDRPVVNETESTNLWASEIKWEMSESERLLYRILHTHRDSKLICQMVDDVSHSYPDALTLNEARAKLDPEDFELLTKELGKPMERRFQPDPDKVIKAAREQLGLGLTLTNRVVTVLEVTKVE